MFTLTSGNGTFEEQINAQNRQTENTPDSDQSTLLTLASEGIYSDYNGAECTFWMVDEDPKHVKLMDMKRVPVAKKKTGYWNSEGWVSYRGRLIQYPREYIGYKATANRRAEYAELTRRARSDEFVVLYGNIFLEHPNQKYPKGQLYEVYIPKKAWLNLTKEERWNYLRDLDVSGYSIPFADRMKEEAAARERFEREELPLYIDMWRNARVPESLIRKDTDRLYLRLEETLNPVRFETHIPPLIQC